MKQEASMSARFDIYREVHKGVRKALFDLAIQSGNTDFSSAEPLKRLREQFTLTKNLLEVHAHCEDTYVEPLLRQCDAPVAARFAAAHTALETTVSHLQGLLDTFDINRTDVAEHSQRFYLELTRFIGEYLQHIADEEQQLMPLLWERFDDAALLEVETTVRASLPPPVMANFLSVMIPAMNHHERTGLLTGMKQMAPPEVFDGVCQLSQNVLSEHDWARLDATVSYGA
jgi:hypothetical protein